jgi:hypothetical protein
MIERYSVSNLNDMSKLTGKFNSIRENKKLMIVNEMTD